MDSKAEQFDFCIIGGGTAGCVLANRLSENGRHRVVLLEAGPRDWHPFIHIPATCLFLQSNPTFNWLLQSEPEHNANGRRFKLSQGKGLGGSSSINGMLHVRGAPADFDIWAQSGCTGWSYDDVLPFYRKAESYQGGEDHEHGRDGPHSVSDFLAVHPLTKAFVDAADEIGVPFNADMNGARREGVAYYQQNRKGRFRAQPAQTYLRQARRRANLDIRTEAIVTRIMFDGARAVGVEYRQGGALRTLRVNREVIIAAGALKSPHLLQLSGIGDPAHLSSLGIPLRAAAPGVGQNLSDHFQVRVGHRVQGVITLNERTRGWPLIKEVLNYTFRGKGMLTMGAGTAALFANSRDGLEQADMQLIFAPGSFAAPGVLETLPGMTIGCWPSRPESRGTVLAASADPMQQPAIRLNYLSAQEDERLVIAGTRLIRKLFAAPALARWSAGETFPGPQLETDTEILDFARERASSGLHFAGTCRMGGEDAVLDPKLRVRVVSALRVVDASAMPGTTIGNTNATVVMVAEKAAAMILESIAA